MSTSENNEAGESFVRLLLKNERIVRAYIRGSGISSSRDVDEIMQEVSIVAWRKFDSLKEPEMFANWACVIARYEILTWRRKYARDRLVLCEEVCDFLAEESVEEISNHERRLNYLEKCVQRLPRKSRDLILSSYSKEATIDQVAKANGKKANALYQQLWRIRRILENCVEGSMQTETDSCYNK